MATIYVKVDNGDGTYCAYRDIHNGDIMHWVREAPAGAQKKTDAAKRIFTGSAVADAQVNQRAVDLINAASTIQLADVPAGII